MEDRTKVCNICRVAKPLDAFPRRRGVKDGRGPYCSPCRKIKYGDPIRASKAHIQPPESGQQTCRVCRETKDLSEFHWQRDKGRHAYICKSCRSAREKAAHAANPERRRANVIRIKYGMSLADYDDLLARQGGGCAMCGATTNPDGPSLAVDHCHATGAVRGILCGPCNKGIGLLKDDPALLARGVEYLRGR